MEMSVADGGGLSSKAQSRARICVFGIHCKLCCACFTGRMQFEFSLKPAPPVPSGEFLMAGGQRIPLAVVRSDRARRYLLGLRPDGSARLTIPRRGSVREGRQFAERNTEWLVRQMEKLAQRASIPTDWLHGTEIFFHGEKVKLEVSRIGEKTVVQCGSEMIVIPKPCDDLRPLIVQHLWRLAAREFPPRVFAFAKRHQLSVQRVTVRNQRSRWGSCSRRGTISLNWRLIQTPPPVQDYIIIHELMHLREMNHSPRYWREVESVCSEYRVAERWLKQNSHLLR
jgi:predicted metal-dependent hydrolase